MAAIRDSAKPAARPESDDVTASAGETGSHRVAEPEGVTDAAGSAESEDVTGTGTAAADAAAVPVERRLEVGDIAPDFILQDQDGASVSLPQFRGRRVVLYFYPAAMTPGCTTQATDFNDNLAELSGAGIAVLGISPDSVPKLAKFRDKEGLTFPLLSDPERAVLQAYGAFGEKSMYGKKVIGVIRSTLVVGPDGHVEKAMYNVKATGHVAKLLRELDLAA